VQTKNYGRNLILLLAILFGLVLPRTSHAQGPELDLIYQGKPGPIFSISGIVPGQKISKEVIVRNLSSTKRDLSIQVTNISNPSLASVVKIEILAGSQRLFWGPLLELSYPNEKYITSILPGDTPLTLSLALDKEAGNQYQGQTMTLDLIFGLLGQPGPLPIPKPPTQIITKIVSKIQKVPVIKKIPFIKKVFIEKPTTVQAIEEAPKPTEKVTPPTPTVPLEEKGAGEEVVPWYRKIPCWLWILLILVLAAIVHLILYLVKRKKKKQQTIA